jgi:hypothetical protein
MADKDLTQIGSITNTTASEATVRLPVVSDSNDVILLYEFPKKKTARIEFPAKPGREPYKINPAVTFTVDVDRQILRFIAEVPVGQWLALGWGWHMFDVDMLLL